MSSRPAAGGGRWVEVDPQRLPRWLAGFAERHGTYQVAPGPRLVAADGALAELHPPPGVPAIADLDLFVDAVGQPRRIGLLLARRGGVAVGVALGDRLEASKVDSRYVQGRTAAGGWSQQRFARRRENQARAAAADGADVAARVLLPAVDRLTAVVTGGDRRAVDVILADPRLAAVAALRADRFLAVGEPRLAVLESAARQARAAAQDAADVAAAILLPEARRLAALVTGGDRRAVDAVLADPRLVPVAALRAERFLDVPEPKLAVLQAAIRPARAVRIRLVDP